VAHHLLRTCVIGSTIALSTLSTGWSPDRSGTREVQARPELRGLVLAAAAFRPVPARLTGGFGHAPLAAAGESGGAAGSHVPALVRREASMIDVAAGAETVPPRSLAARGVAHLLIGRPDDAIADIEIALTREPRRAAWWTDLSAAYLARASNGSRPDDVVRALDAARRAVEIAPELPEARFNLALSLEANTLPDAAALAWRRYGEIDSRSPWSLEAQAHERSLAADRARRIEASGKSCFFIAERFWENGAARVADALRRGDTGAAAKIAEAIDGQVSTCAGDRMLIQTTVRHAMGCRNGGCETLALGFAALERGFRLEREDRAGGAREAYAEAERHLAGAESPAALVAAVEGAAAAIRGRASEAQRQRLMELAGLAAQRGHHGISGVAWLQAVNATYGFERLGEVLELSRRAFAAFTQDSDPLLLASGHNLLSTYLAIAGARDQAWEHRLAALRLHAGTFVDSDRRLNNLIGAGRLAAREQLDGAAAAYEEAALSAMDHEGTSAQQSLARISLAQTLERLGSTARAAAVVNEGLARLDADLDPRMRAALDARLAAVEGALALPDAPQFAIDRLTAAVAYHESVNDRRRLPGLLMQRARAHVLGGNALRARDDLLQGATLIEGGARAAGEQVGAYFDGVWRLYAELVKLDTLIQAEPLAALHSAERVLRHQDAPRASSDTNQLTSVLARDESILRYLSLDDRWLCWVVTSEGIELVQHEIGEADLAFQVARMLDLMERGGTEQQVRASLTALHDLLIAPLPPQARRARKLIVVADGPLARVPFPALWDAARQRYLIEDHTIVRARGAIELLRGRAAGGPAEEYPRPARALVIGNPSIDHQWWGGLPELRSSEAEARMIGGFYPDGTVLTGGEATPSRVRQAIAARDVLHFAGHAVQNPRTGDVSLLLSSDPGARAETQALSFETFFAPGNTVPRLVVLAACRSGAGPRRHASGLTGLPERLQAKGVEIVIASAWDVEDSATQGLMIPFHRAVIAGAHPVDALRDAQLALLRSTKDADRRPAVWGAFMAMGSQ
jgi:CHAT domain-containing protein